MPKIVKIGLALLLPLLVILGGVYGLAKIGVIPVQSLARKNKALGVILRLAKLTKPEPVVRARAVAAPDPLAAEKKALAAQRAAFDEERTAWQAQRDSQAKNKSEAEAAALTALPDPKELARMATVYEQMPPDTVTRILAKLPDAHALGLLRRMDEKQVAQILALVTPEKAARFTMALSRAASVVAPARTASNAP